MATDYWRRSATDKQRKDTNMWKDDLKNYLAISKEGVPVDKLNEMLDNDGVGQIPFAKLGFQHLNHFLFECGDFLQLGKFYQTGQLFLFIAQTKVPSAVDNIAQLVKGQERSKGTQKNPRPLRHQISSWLPIYEILRHSVRNDNARDYQPPPKHFPRRSNNNRGRSNINNGTQSRPNYSGQSNFNQLKKFSFNNDSGSDREDELAKWEFCSSLTGKKEKEENDLNAWGPEPSFSFDTVDNAQQKATTRSWNNNCTIQRPKLAISYHVEKDLPQNTPLPQNSPFFIPSLSMVLARLSIQPAAIDPPKRIQQFASTNQQSMPHNSDLQNPKIVRRAAISPSKREVTCTGKIRSFVQPPREDAPPTKTCILCSVVEMSRSTKDYKFMVLDNSKKQQLKNIENEMGSLYEEDEDYKIPHGYLQPGCYGVFIPEWEKWVRCHIRMTMKPELEQFPARLIDYAMYKVVARQNVRYMTDKFYNFPPQSYRAKLDPPCEEKLQQLEDFIMSHTMTFTVTDAVYHAPSEFTILSLKVANSRKWDQLCSAANRKNGEN